MWTIAHQSDKAMQRHFSRASDSYNPQYKPDKFMKESLPTQQIKINSMTPPSPPLLLDHHHHHHQRIETGSVTVVKESGSGGCCGGKNYWKVNFLFVLLPFMLCGVPIHALLFHEEKRQSRKEDEEEDKKRRQFRRRKNGGISYWLKTLFTSSCPMAFFSIILLPLALLMNLGPIYFFSASFNSLVILGQVDEDLVSNTINLFLYLPFLIIVDYVWIFGHSLERLIQSFSSLSLWRRAGSSSSSSSSSGHQDKGPVQMTSAAPSCRLKMVIMYLLLGMIHTIHFFIIDHRAKMEDWNQETIWQHWTYYTTTIFYSLMLPVYASFCWAILFQFQILSNFIDVLILRRDVLKMEYLALFKTSYKIIADSILQINKLFSILFSWILLALAGALYVEAQDAGLYFFRLLTSSTKLQQQQLATAATNSLGGDPTAPTTTMLSFALTPDLVRSFVGQVVSLILYAILMIFTIWQAIQANDEARYFHVWLNDFASEQTDDWRSQSTNNKMATTAVAMTDMMENHIYHAFRQLKFYVHSRMEQEKPALLNITILFLIPPLQKRLVNYQVRH